MKTLDIELAVVKMFNPRQTTIIPNVSWGLDLHECDLLIIRPSMYCVEVEIKTSKQDLLNDLKKKHGHKSKRIKELYYALPECLLSTAVEKLPEHCGIIVVKTIKYTTLSYYRASVHRKAIPNKDAIPLSLKTYTKALQLLGLRIWKLKNIINLIK